jgi:Uma2 family endonuclease
VTKALKKDATYADLVAVPENFVAEILGGELYASPRPIFSHAAVASALDVLLGGPFRFGINGPGGWLIVAEPELHLGADVLVPDLAGWRTERISAEPAAAYPTLAPDWVCEVLSPSTEAIDRTKKLKIYARERVAHVWLIDPRSQTLEVLRPAGHGWSLLAKHEGDDRVRASRFRRSSSSLAASGRRERRPLGHPARIWRD